MILEYLPYTVLLFLVYVIAINKKEARQNKLLWIFMLFSLFSGLRYNVGHDYMDYYEAVLQGKGGGADRFEFLFRYLCYILVGMPALFMLVTSFATQYFVIKGIGKFSPQIATPIIAYLCVPFFFIEYMCVIRFAFAVALMFYAILSYLDNKKIWLFLVFYVVAINCHVTAAITILALIPFSKLSPKIHLIFLIGSFFVGQVVLNYFVHLDYLEMMDAYYSRYLINENTDEGQKMLLVYAFFAFLNILCLYRAKKEKSNYLPLLSLVNIGFCLLFMFSYNLMFAGRISRYFIMLFVVALPLYKIPFLKMKSSVVVLRMVLVLLFFAELYISQNSFYTTKSKSYMPYEMILFKDN